MTRSLKLSGYWCHKIGDVQWNSQASFHFKRPFDIVGSTPYGKFVAIESKQIKKWQPFGVKELAPHQIENLTLIEKSQGLAYVFLNVRIPREENRLLAWPFWKLKQLGRIPTRELKEHRFLEGKRGLFNLIAFEDYFK